MDYREALSRHKCWDVFTEWSYRQYASPDDCILQNREELIGLCEWIEAHGIRSYLEIGCWTGKLVNVLHELFRFEKVAAADIGLCEKYGMAVDLHPDIRFFQGDSHSPEFEAWRRELGPVDLVLLDGDHTYQGLKQDAEVNLRHGARYLAVHDITSTLTGTEGVKRFWDELEGDKTELVKPHVEVGLDHSQQGIGLWRVPGR